MQISSYEGISSNLSQTPTFTQVWTCPHSKVTWTSRPSRSRKTWHVGNTLRWCHYTWHKQGTQGCQCSSLLLYCGCWWAPKAPFSHLSERTRWASTPRSSDGCRVFQDGFDFVPRPPLRNCFYTVKFQPDNVAGLPEHLVETTDLQPRCHHYEEGSAGPYRLTHTEGSKSVHEEQSALFLSEERCSVVQSSSFYCFTSPSLDHNRGRESAAHLEVQHKLVGFCWYWAPGDFRSSLSVLCTPL